MPDIDLAAIKARADAATPGPWRAALVSAYEDDDGQQRGKGGIYPGTEPGPPPLFLTMDWLATDAEFIAHAREDVPALLAEVERLTAINSRFAQKIMNGIRGVNAALAPEILRQKAEAWDQGHESASDAECGYINPNEDVNPYREQS